MTEQDEVSSSATDLMDGMMDFAIDRGSNRASNRASRSVQNPLANSQAINNMSMQFAEELKQA